MLRIIGIVLLSIILFPVFFIVGHILTIYYIYKNPTKSYWLTATNILAFCIQIVWPLLAILGLVAWSIKWFLAAVGLHIVTNLLVYYFNENYKREATAMSIWAWANIVARLLGINPITGMRMSRIAKVKA